MNNFGRAENRISKKIKGSLQQAKNQIDFSKLFYLLIDSGFISPN